MHTTAELVRARIARFARERIEPALYRARRPLTVTVWEAPGEPVPFAEAIGARFEPFSVGKPWGKPWGTTWFHVTGRVPEGWRTDGADVELVVDLGFTTGQPGFQAEGMVYTADGRIVKAVEPRNAHVRIEDADEIDLYIEAASNPDVGGTWTFAPTPLGDKTTAGTDPIYTLRVLEVAQRDETVWQLSRDVDVLTGLFDVLPADSVRAAEVLRALERAVDAMDPHDVAGTAEAGRAALAGVLETPAAPSAHRVTAVGHAHIDSAWLWPVRETVRKCARTFSNVLDLMETHDDFVFACSSAQQYAWIKEFYPELFERIARRVKEGRFVPVGGMWVESDTNLPGGEAMARQFVHGAGFFLREFGVESTIGWLPDSFGYSGALPQIMAAAGIQSFLTQKISWNETNVFPHHTFEWEGIDGTRMFTHFPPVNAYNSDLSATDLARAERNYAEKGSANSSVVPFGYGDGGGGPTREMLAAAARTRSLEGSPAVRLATPQRFFADARAEYPNAPVWSGELYLEFHRGTYTSQARTKRGNRRSEHLLREAELWATTAAVRNGAAYPYDALERAWQSVLLQQFHDILPGSSIAWVYRDAERVYAEVEEALEGVIGDAIAALGGAGAVDEVPPEDLPGSSSVSIRSLAGAPSLLEPVLGAPPDPTCSSGGTSSTAEQRVGVVFNASPFAADGVPALGAGVPDRKGEARVERAADGFVLSNALVRFELDPSGRIRSAVDAVSGREAIAPGEATAELQLFRDTPTQWDAWDIDEHYRRHGEALTEVEDIEVVADGADRVAVRVRRSFGSSRVEQEFALNAGSGAIEITTEIDWHERQKLLKLAFPLDVHTDVATSEVQFGHITRATHQNTSWDVARFETSAHRWMHVGEPGFGVAIANDASYGHDVTRHPRPGGGTTTLVRQSLLRAPLYPDPDADQGRHVFRSSFAPGADIPAAVREGYRLNLPLRAGAAPVAPLVSVRGGADAAGAGAQDGECGVVIEAVKLAEDRSGDVVVRLYEAFGRRSRAEATFHLPVSSIVETDLLERERATPAALVGTEGPLAILELRPFQLVTLRVRPR